jgi:alpha-mannosidase
MPYRLLVTLDAGSPLLQLELIVDNTVEDHRLRLTVQTPVVTDQMIAGAPFQLVRRPLRPAARPEWFQRPATHQPFTDLAALEGNEGGVALFAGGLREVEGQRSGKWSQLLVTVLRSVGWLSRDDLCTRRNEAGPCFPVAGALQLGRTSISLGVMPYSGTLMEAEILRRCREQIAPPMAVTPAAHHGTLPAEQELLRLEPSCVALTALLPTKDGLEARLVNLSERKVRARLRGPYAASRVQLDGEVLQRGVTLDRIPMRAGAIVTLHLDRTGAEARTS